MQSRSLPRFAASLLLLWVWSSPRPALAADPQPVEGRKLFLKNCAPCHGPDGRARNPAARKLGVKDLTVNTLPEDKIRTQIREGVQSVGNAGKMPAFKDAFSDEQLAALVAEVMQFRKKPRP